jgi:NTP pyrophosphatase (non-canonical NTP hydrolase)
VNQTTLTAVQELDVLLESIDPEGNLGCDCAGATLEGISQAQELCHALASQSGWWTDKTTGQRKTLEQVNVAEKLCLIHSEISEAMEGDRKNLMDDHLPHRKMIEVELADAMIRILDLAGFLGLDVAGATIEKLAYNQRRADHKLENRQMAGGKAY